MITTKEQERKALEKIRKIVEELEENSYVRTAFEGCFEDAENNIEDDAAYSMKARYEHSEEKLAEALTENKKLKEENEALKKKNEALTERRDQLSQENNEAAIRWQSTYEQFREHEARAIRAEAEIIQLKAKLYDLITK